MWLVVVGGGVSSHGPSTMASCDICYAKMCGTKLIHYCCTNTQFVKSNKRQELAP